MAGLRWFVYSVSRWPGVAKVVSAYRFVRLDLPRATTAVGVLAVLGVGSVHLYLLVTDRALSSRFPSPTYLDVYCAVLFVAALLAALGMVIAPRVGWALGTLVATAGILMYVASRFWGLPALPQLLAYWDYALGTFMMMLAAVFLALHFTVLTGLNVAFPHRRQWYD